MLEAGDKYTANQPTKKFPVVLGQRIYYLSSDKARTTFLGNPHRYTSQPPPLTFLPPKIAIIGPPKSGKTSGTQMLSYFGHSIFSHMSPLPLVLFAVANQLVSTLGVVKFSIGEALRYQLMQFPESSLAEQIRSYLLVGETIPDELCVAALERKMLEAEVNTRGYVRMYIHMYVRM